MWWGRQELGLDVPDARRWGAVLAQPKRLWPGGLGVWVIHPDSSITLASQAAEML